jgi:hypothetical protein
MFQWADKQCIFAGMACALCGHVFNNTIFYIVQRQDVCAPELLLPQMWRHCSVCKTTNMHCIMCSWLLQCC